IKPRAGCGNRTLPAPFPRRRAPLVRARAVLYLIATMPAPTSMIPPRRAPAGCSGAALRARALPAFCTALALGVPSLAPAPRAATSGEAGLPAIALVPAARPGGLAGTYVALGRGSSALG